MGWSASAAAGHILGVMPGRRQPATAAAAARRQLTRSCRKAATGTQVINVRPFPEQLPEGCVAGGRLRETGT